MTEACVTAEKSPKLVSLKYSNEVWNWTKNFRCTEKELRAAVAAVGTSAEAVRSYLTAARFDPP